MRHENDRSEPIRVLFHRLKAVLALRQRRFVDLCARLPVTPRHAYFVLTGARAGSAALLDAVRRELGEPDWLFVTGQAHALADEGVSHAES